MLSLGSNKHPSVCRAMGDVPIQSGLSLQRFMVGETRSPGEGRQGFLRKMEDKEDPQECLGGRHGAISNMVSPEIFLDERVSSLRPTGQAEIAWVFKAWETGQVWGI